MGRLRQIGTWLWRAWPFIVLGLIVAANCTLAGAIPARAPFIDKWTSALAQGVGSLVVIYSLSKNLGMFGRRGLWAVFVGWCREFPHGTPRSYVLHGEPAHFKLGGNGAMMFVAGKSQTVEERVDALERQLAAMTEDLTKKMQDLLQDVKSHKFQTLNAIAENRAAVVALADKVKETAVGGLLQQIFGVLLASYGILLGALTQP